MIPLTRSRSSFSVITSRVWPLETHSRSAVSTSAEAVERDDSRDRRHHLARLLLVQVEDAGQHPGLARVEVPAGVGLGDQPLELVGRAAVPLLGHVHAEQPQNPVRDRRHDRDQRLEGDLERAQRAARPGARPSLRGRSRRTSARSRRRSAARTRSRRRRRPRRSPRRRRAPAGGQPVLEEVRERGLGERADRDRGHRDADLDGGDVVVDLARAGRAPARRPSAPSSRITSRRARRERTSAYSAITKNALTPTRTAARISFRPFTERAASLSAARGLSRCPGRSGSGRALGAGRPAGRRYFEEVLRRRSSRRSAVQR